MACSPSSRTRFRSFFGSAAFAVVLCGALFASSPALAERGSVIPPATNTAFGADDQIVLSDELQFQLKKPEGRGWELHLQPSLDYFIGRHISVGGLVSIDASDGGGRFGVGGRAGYAIPLGDRVTFWPLVMIKGVRADEKTSTELWVKAPFLFHIVPHFFVGAGPYFFSQMTGGSYSEFGLSSIVGGYF